MTPPEADRIRRNDFPNVNILQIYASEVGLAPRGREQRVNLHRVLEAYSVLAYDMTGLYCDEQYLHKTKQD